MHRAAKNRFYIVIAEGIFGVTILFLPTSSAVRNDASTQF